MLETIKRDLADNYRPNTDEVIAEFIIQYTTIASHSSNRKKDDTMLYPYVFTAVKEAYIRRGNEGMNSSNEGGLSSSYIDIEEKLRKDVLAIRIPLF